MRALVFDTETSGMVDFKASPQSGVQPHLIQLGMLLVDTNDWKVKNRFSCIVKLPDGVKIHEKAREAHGISEEECTQYGIMRAAALGMFNQLAMKADMMVAYNSDFDILIMNSLHHRVCLDSGKEMVNYTTHLPKICAMKAATPVLKIPGNYGKFKWPKLTQAYSHFTGKEVEGWHDALADAEACLEVFKGLVEVGGVQL